jgi:hypothetical protein
MPAAVEFTLTRAKGKPLILLFLVGASVGQPPKAEAPVAGSGDGSGVGNGV